VGDLRPVVGGVLPALLLAISLVGPVILLVVVEKEERVEAA
jgi:hypothetical protein